MRCCLAVEMLVNQAFDRILTDGQTRWLEYIRQHTAANLSIER
jgi:hypothetical protein